MYDLRILVIWMVLGFLLYLIAIRKDKVSNYESEELEDYTEDSEAGKN